MKKSVFTLLAYASLLPVFISCNIYAPLSATSSVEDYRQAALACLHKGDYSCALTNYNKLPDGAEKSQDLCTVTMGEAGMSLIALVNVVSSKTTGAQLLGALGQQLMPWTSGKATAALSALQLCGNIVNDGTNQNLIILLQAVSLLVDCSTRMAKTDVYLANSDTDTNCNTPGDNDGVLTKSDISVDPLGVVDSSHLGMCPADADQCVDDITTLTGLKAQLDAAGLGDMATNISLLPGGIAKGAFATTRIALRTTLSN